LFNGLPKSKAEHALPGVKYTSDCRVHADVHRNLPEGFTAEEQPLVECVLVRKKLYVTKHAIGKRFVSALDKKLDTLELQFYIFTLFTGDRLICGLGNECSIKDVSAWCSGFRAISATFGFHVGSEGARHLIWMKNR